MCIRDRMTTAFSNKYGITSRKDGDRSGMTEEALEWPVLVYLFWTGVKLFSLILIEVDDDDDDADDSRFL